MRADLTLIADWIEPQARVLDLGCGEGELLAYLQQARQIHGYGLEIDAEKITTCIRRGVNVIEQDLDDGLNNFRDASYDVVIMSQALQALLRPDQMLDEMLRVGRECIVTFPNFAWWRCRLHLALKGRMPVSRSLPHQWYNTPNIHLTTFKDFEALCTQKSLKILARAVGNSAHQTHWTSHLWPNFFGEVAIYRISR